ncbi:hypothetical protein OSTOST_08694 [Ostertagia ostertagi]
MGGAFLVILSCMQTCIAFPQCRHRVKRNLFQDCNICTPDISRKRKKRNAGLPSIPSKSNPLFSAMLSLSWLMEG